MKKSFFLTGIFTLVLVAGGFSPSASLPADSERGTRIQKNPPLMPRPAQNPTLDWVNDIGGSSPAITVQGDYAYTCEGRRFVVLDAKDPGNLRFICNLPLEKTIRSLAVRGSNAFVSTRRGLFYIVDISDPHHPAILHRYDVSATTPYFIELKVYGNHTLYARDAEENLYAVDIEIPASINFPQPFAKATDFQIQANRMFVLYENALSRYDLNDPQLPAFIDTQSLSSPVSLVRFALKNEFGYFVGVTPYYTMGVGTLLVIYDLADFQKINPVNEIRMSDQYGYGEIAIQADRLIYLHASEGLHIFDITQPDTPILLGSSNLWRRDFSQMAFAGDHVLLGSRYDNIQSIDISDPSQPEEVSAWFGLLPLANQVYHANDLAYVATQLHGLRILDLSDPEDPVVLSEYSEPETMIKEFVLNGNTVYAWISKVTRGIELAIIDVSDPAAPQKIDSMPFTTYFDQTLALTLDMLYYLKFANNRYTLQSADVSDPHTFVKRDSIVVQSNYGFGDFDADDRALYVGGFTDELLIYDRSDPDNLQLISSLSIPPQVHTIEVYQDLVYILTLDNTLVLVDVSDLAHPQAVYSQKQNDFLTSLDFYQSWGLYSGLFEIGLLDPASPSNPISGDRLESPVSSWGMGWLAQLRTTPSGFLLASHEDGLWIGQIESFEPPTQTLTVTSTADEGPGSLRQAIWDAHAKAGPDTLRFAIPKTDAGYDEQTGVWTIQPFSNLPANLEESLVIDGHSQTKSLGDTNPFGPEIVLDGSQAGENSSCFTAFAPLFVHGLAVQNFGAGFYLQQMDGGAIADCYIGTDHTGMRARGNDLGIRIQLGVNHFNISRNIISGNPDSGISVTDSCHHITIIGNIIGLGSDTTTVIENSAGVFIADSDSNGIYDNIFCGIRFNGLGLSGANDNEVGNNFIGALGSWNTDLGNGRHGIYLRAGAKRNHIFENVIGYNNVYGILIQEPATLANRITRNAISLNEYQGIKLENGGNSGLAAPVNVSLNGNRITGQAGPRQTVELYADSQDEGKQFLGSVKADENGGFTFTLSYEPELPHITAIAIDGNGNTSEFSQPMITAVDSQPTAAKPDRFFLAQNYPNPFNPETTLHYDLAANSHVTITIYNVLGKEISTLIDRQQSPGSYTLRWTATNTHGHPVPAGLYFCRMTAGTFVATRKMVVVR